jgi:hypothetical protein
MTYPAAPYVNAYGGRLAYGGLAYRGLASAIQYALKGDGAAVHGVPATDILLVSGDTVKVTFKNSESSGASNKFLFDGADATATRGYIVQQGTTDTIAYSTGNASELLLDGAVVTSTVTAYPIDADQHIFLMTASANMTIGTILAQYGITLFGLMTIIQLQVTTVARGVETWDFNTRSLTVIHENGGGSDINLFGVTAEDWVQI